VGTEHLLLGLIDDGSGDAGEALRQAGIRREIVWRAVSTIVQPGDRDVVGEVPLTPRARRAMTRATELAMAFGGLLVEPEHLLAALIAEHDAIATRTLASIGVDLAVLAKQLPSWPGPPTNGGPVCPNCRTSINARVGTADITSGGRDFIIIYCVTCQTTLGVR
jgi:ATP-dependent Clp protease ATP-binding subunit ClpC